MNLTSSISKISGLFSKYFSSQGFPYEASQDFEQIKECFLGLKATLKRKVEDLITSGLHIYWEEGSLESEELYWYLKAFGQHGLLCQITRQGWVIYRSEKKWNEPVFVRKGPAWDQVTIFSRRSANKNLFRLESKLDSQDLISVSLYEHFLTKAILDQED